MMKNLKNKKIFSKIGFIILALSILFLIFTIWIYDSFEIILEFLMQYLTPFLNEQYLYTFFGVVFGAFIALFALLGFVIVEKTKELVEKILFNPHYMNLGPTATKEYKLWMYVKTFNPEILRFFDWKEIKKLITSAFYTDEKDANGEKRLNYEGENYKCAFDRFKKIITNFSSFFWTTICLLFLSLISLFLVPLFKIGFIIRLIVVMNVIMVFLLSFFSLIFAALVIKSLFLYGSKKEIEKLKKEIFK